MATPNLTAARLRELLHYNPDTGLFTWLVSTTRRIRVGAVAGTLVTSGYVSIGVDRDLHRAHRLAWLYVYGEWPKHDIDHINGNRSDNRIANLRDVTRTVNLQNIRSAHKDKQSATPLGVYADKKKWAAAIRVNGERCRLGTFDTPEEAHAAYLDAKRKYHEGCTI